MLVKNSQISNPMVRNLCSWAEGLKKP